MLDRIAAACTRAGRDPRDVALLPVSKAVPTQRLRLAVSAGMTNLAENRVQEALAKEPQVEGARWHLVGHLQSNKAGRAAGLFEEIHSVDSLAIARRLDGLAGQRDRARLPVYLQVNVDRDPAKDGFLPEVLEADLPALSELSRLELRGLMTVGRQVAGTEEARPTFIRLRELSEHLRSVEAALGGGLSMGMTDDFEVAVEEGATVVRVGRAIFGERPS